jgi:hypothetical protein
MIPYVLASIGALGFFVSGFVARHFAQSKFIPLSSDARKLRDEVLLHLDAMASKSEIMIRHDAQAFRNTLAGR